MTSEWHANRELVDRYAAGRLDLVAESSLERHVDRCSLCRALMTEAAPVATLDEVWRGVRAEASVPAPTRWGRIGGAIAHRVGLTQPDVIILRGSSALGRSWLLAVAGTVVVAMVAGWLQPVERQTLLLLVGPLVPAGLVAAAYDATDPLRDLAAASPRPKMRIALVRTVAALVGAAPLLLGLGLVLPDVGSLVLTWLLPSATLVLAVLNLMTWTAPRTAVSVCFAAWVVVVALLRSDGLVTDLATLGLQSIFLAAAAAGAAVLVLRLRAAHTPGGYA